MVLMKAQKSVLSLLVQSETINRQVIGNMIALIFDVSPVLARANNVIS